MMNWFRERVTSEMLAEVNDFIIGRKAMDTKMMDLPPLQREKTQTEGVKRSTRER